jgi:hypothetical protein
MPTADRINASREKRPNSIDYLTQRAESIQRHSGIHLAESGANDRHERRGGAAGSHDKFFRAPAKLGAKKVHFFTGLFLKRGMTDIAHHADNFKVHAARIHDLAHRIRSGPKPPRHRFIDDGDLCRSVHRVVCIKFTPGAQRYPHRVDISGIHDSWKRVLAWPIGFPLRNDSPTPVAT